MDRPMGVSGVRLRAVTDSRTMFVFAGSRLAPAGRELIKQAARILIHHAREALCHLNSRETFEATTCRLKFQMTKTTALLHAAVAIALPEITGMGGMPPCTQTATTLVGDFSHRGRRPGHRRGRK